MQKDDLRGWVYIASNPSMEGMVKVGFTMKDPAIRIQDFDSAALPTPYRLEYDLLVINPYKVEQTAHSLLVHANVGREWFRCSVEQAKAVLHQAAGNTVVVDQSIATQTSSPPLAAHAASMRKRTPNTAFMRARTPSAALAAIVGDAPLPRADVTKKLWEYIKKNKLQDEVQKRIINADAKLKEVFGKDRADIFDLTNLINRHLK